MKAFTILGVTGLLLLTGVLAFIYSGVYPIGADVPHNAFTYRLLETLRERSASRAAADIDVPPLDDPAMLLSGGADYNDMCAGCHLQPGREESDLSLGLYPEPPNLAGAGRKGLGTRDEAQRRFWIIKHGIKASGMAAFGKTHDDARIWAMVAFLRRLPGLSPEQYQILTARGETESSGH